jgi:two-component system, OmpR family, alkaline phosphatase synthesis response regulator PhoP
MDNSKYSVLLVDDEPDIIEFLSYNLRRDGFIVHTSNNGKDAIDLAIEYQPHLIVLDIMMPGMDGIEACRAIRSNTSLKNTAITFLTARGEDYSQIEGFEAGADDYIKKPVSPRVLVSRIKALLKRFENSEHTDQRLVIKLKDLLIDRERFIVERSGKKISFSRKEFDLLYMLTSRPDKVFTRDEIFEQVWGDDVIVGERTIDVHIHKIREKIGMQSIRTIKGVGYCYTQAS